MCVHAVGPPTSAQGPATLFVITRARVDATRNDFERLRLPSMTALNPTFAKLGVRDEIVRALNEDGKEHTFAIQELTLPLAMAGDDLIGQARTGMGKTLAFGVPLLQTITTDTERPLTGAPRALIVVPTRELCLQVYGDLAHAAKYLTAEEG